MSNLHVSLADGVRARDLRSIARAISLIENESAGAGSLLAGLQSAAGHAYLVGVTGPPGVGKSTLVDGLIKELRRAGTTVAVLAVDPSSPFSGGAMLGDRVRMQAHAADMGVFIRSMATRGHAGGLARATAGAATVLDASGFDVVIIETVGVGQAEVDIARASDVSIVVVMPGTGDDVQASKAGLMEIADIFVVNKADREGADRTAASLTAMLSLAVDAGAADTWRPPILLTEATSGRGLPELVAAIENFRQHAGPYRRELRRGGTPPSPAAGVTLDHVGIGVQDAAGVLTFFDQAFGLRADVPQTVGLHQVRFVPTGDASIELVEPLSPDAEVARFLAKKGAGLHHICLRVPDIDAMLAALTARGIRLIDEVARPGAHGSRIAFIHPSSAWGLLIELKQAPVDN